MFPTHPDYHESMANNTGEGVITMVTPNEKLRGFAMCEEDYRKSWTDGRELARDILINWTIKGLRSPIIQGYALRMKVN